MNCNAWKLTRVEPREKPRTDWPARWTAAGNSVNWEGAFKDEFIALKTSPIWRALGSGVGGFDDATGFDFPPFAINSGMGWIAVDFNQERNKTTMNNQNKVNLIIFIAKSFSDEQCANILAQFTQKIANKRVILAANSANWDESEHPRAEDGRFTDGDDYDDYTENKPKKKHGREGHTIVEVVKEELEEAKKNGSAEEVRELEKKLKTAKWLHSGAYERQQAKRKAKQKAMIKQYEEIDDEIDHLEEMYGDRERGVGFKWPQTQEGDEARKRYRHLTRLQKRLDKQIDWKDADND